MDDAVELAVAGAAASAGEVRPEIAAIFADVFQHHGAITLATSRKDVTRWDSLQHVALVVALESTFGVSLSMDEMAEIDSVRDIHVVLARHGA